MGKDWTFEGTERLRVIVNERLAQAPGASPETIINKVVAERCALRTQYFYRRSLRQALGI